MTDNNNTFSVATIGLDAQDSETKVIYSVISISQDRTPKFELQDRTVDKAQLPDVVIINSDNVGAIERWHAYQLMQENKSHISGIMIGSEAPEGCKYFLGKPLLANRLLTLLERVVIEEHQFQPTSVFSQEDNIAPLEATGMHKNVSILVVDDSLPIRTQLKLALSSITKNVDFAEDGEEAIKLIEKKHYNLAFLDVILPNMDGYKICKMIKRDPKQKDTSVIMLTSNSSPADRVKGKAAGCDTYMIKPVKREVFEEVVHEFIENL